MKIGNRIFSDEKKTYIMGILNYTPDSFSDGGKYNRLDAALSHVEQMIEDGADIIDIGAESTRPGHVQISDAEEIERLSEIVCEVKKRFHTVISVDTYKSAVAKEAILQGADLINDIWGLKYDEKMAEVIADGRVSCCLMHNRDNNDYGSSFLAELLEDMKETLRLADQAGIEKDRIMLDPGVGFAKDTKQNILAIRHLPALMDLGYPVLLGTSRKSVIGNTLNLPVDERVEGTMATTAYAVMCGCSYVRVHDVKENKRLIDMLEEIMYA
jgi:dihydropteroate synthase